MKIQICKKQVRLCAILVTVLMKVHMSILNLGVGSGNLYEVNVFVFVSVHLNQHFFVHSALPVPSLHVFAASTQLCLSHCLSPAILFTSEETQRERLAMLLRLQHLCTAELGSVALALVP